MTRKIAAAACAAAVFLASAVPAYAFDCTVAKKPPTAGAVGIDGPGGFVPLKNNPGTEEKPHGGFVAFVVDGKTYSTFLHAPQGVLPPVREGGPADNCDGKGLDSLEECFSG